MVFIAILIVTSSATVTNEELTLMDQMSAMSAVAYCESLTSPFDCASPLCGYFPGTVLVQVHSSFHHLT